MADDHSNDIMQPTQSTAENEPNDIMQTEPTQSTEENVESASKDSLQEIREILERAAICTEKSKINMDEKNEVDDYSTYVEPVPDPYNKAITYLEKHSILQLFQKMTTNIVFKRPENPLDFMIGEIEDIKKAREEETESKTKLET